MVLSIEPRSISVELFSYLVLLSHTVGNIVYLVLLLSLRVQGCLENGIIIRNVKTRIIILIL